MSKQSLNFLIALSSALFLLPVAVLGQTEPETLTLKQAIELAESKNPGLQAQQKNMEATTQQYSQLEGLKDTLGVYGKYLKMPELGGSSMMIEKEFPWPGVLTLQNQVVDSLVKEAKFDFEIAKRDLIIRLQQLFFKDRFLKQRQGLLKEHIQILEDLHQTISSKYRTGKARLSDLLMVEVKLEQLKEELTDLKDQLSVLLYESGQVLDFSKDRQWQWKDSWEVPLNRIQGQAKEASHLGANSFELQKLQSAVRRMELMVELQKESLQPTYSAAVSKMNTNPKAFFGQQEGYLRETQLKKQSMHYKLQNMENELSIKIRQKIRNLETFIREVQLYEQTLIPKGEKMVDVAISEYTVGKVEFASVFKAQEMLIGLQTKYYLLKQKVQIEYLVLRSLLGEPVSAFQKKKGR